MIKKVTLELGNGYALLPNSDWSAQCKKKVGQEDRKSSRTVCIHHIANIAHD